MSSRLSSGITDNVFWFHIFMVKSKSKHALPLIIFDPLCLLFFLLYIPSSSPPTLSLSPSLYLSRSTSLSPSLYISLSTSLSLPLSLYLSLYLSLSLSLPLSLSLSLHLSLLAGHHCRHNRACVSCVGRLPSPPRGHRLGK